MGLSPKRVAFDQCSSAEGERFVKLVTDFNQGVRDLGPLGTGDGLPLPELKEKLSIAKYGEIFTEHEMWRTLDTIVLDEVATHQILGELEQEASAVKDLAARLRLPPPQVLRYVLALQRRGLVDLDGVEGNSPRYKAVQPKVEAA